MAKAPPRDFVRFTPFGFSLAVAAVILLAVGGFAAGYLWGIRNERVKASAAVPATVILPSPDILSTASSRSPTQAGPTTEVTFYSELAGETRKPSASHGPMTTQQPPSSRKEASHGTATAQRTEPPANKPTPSGSQMHPPGGTVPSAKPKDLMVQVASYPVAAEARELKAALEREGYRCEIQDADLGPRGHWFRVRLGPFPDEAQARKAMSRLERERALKGFIVPP